MASIYDTMDPEQRRNATLRGAAAFGDAPAIMQTPGTAPVSGGGMRMGNASTMAQGMLPMTMQAMDNNRTNFDQRVAQGGGAAAVTGRVLGGGLRDAALTAQSLVDDTLVRPSRAIADTVGPALSSFGRGLLGGAGATANPATPAQAPAEQAQVRRLDNALPAQGAPVPTAAVPTPQMNAAAPTAPPATAGAPTDVLGQINRDIAHQQYLQTRPDLNAPTPGGSGPGMFYDNEDPTGRLKASREFGDRAALDNALRRTTWSPRGGYKADEVAVGAAVKNLDRSARLREMSLQNEGKNIDRASASADRRYLADQASDDRRFIAGQNSEDRRYTADTSLRGNLLSARTAQAKLDQDESQFGRRLALDGSKLSQEAMDKQFAQRETSRKAVESRVAGMVPPGADGKPDADGVARHMNVINNAVAQRQQQLQAQIQKGGPNAKAAADELKVIEEKGLGAMDDAAIRKLIVGSQLQQTAQQTATGSLTPWGTDAANTSAPVSSLRQDSGLFGTDYVATHADGSTSVIPSRYLRNNGRPNEDLKILMGR